MTDGQERWNMALFEHLTPADKMKLASMLIKAATGYEVMHDDDEPGGYLRAERHRGWASMGLQAVDPNCEGPPVRDKHEGCGGGLIVRESGAGSDCRKCGAPLSHEEAKAQRKRQREREKSDG